MADEAVAIGPAPAGESYLVAERILDAARQTGSQAIHPGYGFLSENAGFADAVADAGLVFIGPPGPAIRAMGDKAAARGAHGGRGRAGGAGLAGEGGDDDVDDDRVLAAAGQEIGYPVMVKAAAGGGGKGMRVVERAADLAEALAAARREAQQPSATSA